MSRRQPGARNDGPPGARRVPSGLTGDAALRAAAWIAAFGALALSALLLVRLVVAAWPALRHNGLGFLTGAVWAPAAGAFGALPLIAGTLYATGIALLLGTPVALGLALYLTQWAPAQVRRAAGLLVDLLAAVPSVVYGLWGLWVLAPAIGSFGLTTAGLILALMIVPTVAAVAQDVMTSATRTQSDAALALGATPWEAASLGVLRPCRSGLIAAVWLGLGRAFGESMAVAIVLGNPGRSALTGIAPDQTLAATIVHQLGGAGHGLYASALIEIGLLLCVISALVTLVARNYAGRVQVSLQPHRPAQAAERR